MLTINTAKLRVQVAEHIDADALIQGAYWEKADNAVGGRGCFISCLSHTSDAADVERLFGLPRPVIKTAENIFEGLPQNEAKAFFAAIPDAVQRDGKDLSKVVWQFLAAELRALPPQSAKIQAVIDPVIEGMDLLAAGAEWSAAAYAAYGAYAARAAGSAAYAAGSAYAAAAAARIRQRDTLLRLISEAPIVEEA